MLFLFVSLLIGVATKKFLAVGCPPLASLKSCSPALPSARHVQCPAVAHVSLIAKHISPPHFALLQILKKNIGLRVPYSVVLLGIGAILGSIAYYVDSHDDVNGNQATQ